jgi:phosphate/sulfate permease/DNA-binding CsgD family transcriptional regulator
MLIVLLITALTISVFLGKTELERLFSPTMGNKIISFRATILLSAIFIILGAFLIEIRDGHNLSEFVNTNHYFDFLFINITVLVIYLVSNYLKVNISIIQLFFGGITGVMLHNNTFLTHINVPLKLILCWIITPLVAALLAFYINKLFQKYIFSLKIHLLKVQTINRMLLVFGFIFFAFGFGANNAFITTVYLKNALMHSIFIGTLQIDAYSLLILLTGIAVAAGMFLIKDNGRSEKRDISIEHYILAISVSGILLIFFSFVPMINAPLSPSQLVGAAIIGANFQRKHERINFKSLHKSLVTFTLLPLLAALIVFVVVTIFYSFKPVDSVTKTISELPEQLSHYQLSVQFNLLITIIIVASAILIASFAIYFYFNSKKKTEELQKRWQEQIQFSDYQKALTEIEKNAIQLENTNLSTQLEVNRNELITFSLNIREQKQYLESIYNSLQQAVNSDDVGEKNSIIMGELNLLKQKMSYSGDIENIYKKTEEGQLRFLEKLNAKFPNLTAQEKRLMVLLRIGLSSKEIAPLLNISTKSVEISRYRLRTKLGLNRNENFIQFLKTI